MPGPPRKPTVLKLITGNPSGRPLPAAEPIPEPSLPAVPPHLSDEAKVEWDRVANEMHELGMLTRLDRSMLAAYCQAYSDWIEAEQHLQKYGRVMKSPMKTTTRTVRGVTTTETSGGYPIQNPYLAIRNRALELMHRFGAECGLSPASRTRVSTDSGKAAPTRDKAAKYF
jgi:P27 family predicted phage terminase small subunit